jgi:hypothetical protein
MPDEPPPTLDYASRRNANPPGPMRRSTLICMLLTVASIGG